MKNRHENKFKMYLAVKILLDGLLDVLKKLPNYVEYYKKFVAAIAEFEVAVQGHITDTTGIKEEQVDYKLLLAEETVDLSLKMEAYATFNKDKKLIKKVHYTKSELQRASNTKLTEIVKGLYKMALSLGDKLEPYGVSQQSLTTLMDLLEKYRGNIPSSRIAITEGKQFGQQIEEAIDKAEDALEHIDLEFEIIRRANIEAYNKYKSLRKNVNYGETSLAIVGKVIDSRIKKPVQNAVLVFTFESNGNGNGEIHEAIDPITKKTAEKGGFRIKNMPDGMYKVNISKNGYLDQQKKIAITNGELYRLEVELERM